MPMKLADFQKVRFNKQRRGYDIEEVDNYINNLLDYSNTLKKLISTLEAKISVYEEHEKIIQQFIIQYYKSRKNNL